MDFREFDFWVAEARREKTRRKVDQMDDVRFAMWAEGKDFSSYVHQLRMAIMTPAERKAVHDAAWQKLKVIGSA